MCHLKKRFSRSVCIAIFSGEEEATKIVNAKLNKSDNWAETSFGREVMNVS